jgi:DNA polymerase-3 subunit epsilon
MNLKLSRAIVFFDLETTGLNISRDKIVEIAILKLGPDGTREKFLRRVNPGISIPDEASQIHGITNDDVKDMPPFKEIAPEVKAFIGDADMAGYNSNKFDVPFLLEEMINAGNAIDMKGRKTVDVQTIFHKMEQRTLAAAYKFYCSRELENAHSAGADAQATIEILEAQLDRYADLKNDIGFLEEFSRSGKNKIVDFVGRLAENEKGELMYNFGKHAGKTVKEVHAVEPSYHRWMLDNDFPLITKQILKEYTDKIIGPPKSKKDKKPKEQAITTEQLQLLQSKFKRP